jgi:hypothetical protein
MRCWQPLMTSSADDRLRLISALLFDGDVPASEQADFSWSIPILRSNRVPVAVMSRAALVANADTSGTFAQYLSGERERYERQLAAFSEVAARWAEDGIGGVLIKSPGYFPYTSSNVDVLVDRFRAKEARRLLQELGYTELRGVREPYKRLFRRTRPPHLGFPIHVHTAVAWINRFLTGDEALEGARRGADLAYPSADNVFLITTAHWFYEDKQLALRDLYHASLAVADGVDWIVVRARARQAGWGDGLELALALYAAAAQRFGPSDLCTRLPDPTIRRRALKRVANRAARKTSTPARLSKPLCKVMQLVKTTRDPTLTRGAKLQELGCVLYFTVRVKFSWLSESRPVVAISGPDGAGKTTLAIALQEFFARETTMTASYEWMRLGSSNLLRLLRAAGEPLGRRAELHSSSHAAAAWPRRALLGRRHKLRNFWCYVLVADFVIRTWARRVQCRFHCGIHIFDRSAIDAAVDLATVYGFSSAHLPIALTPSPDLQILIKPAAGDAMSLYADYESRAAMLANAGTPLASTVEQAARRVIELISDSR